MVRVLHLGALLNSVVSILLILCSFPAGVLLQGMDWLLVGKQQKEEIRIKKYIMRRRKEEEWSVHHNCHDLLICIL